MNSGSSALISTGRCSALAFAIRSLHHRSRPSCQSILPPVRFRTTTCSMLFTFGFFSASSTFFFSGMARPARSPSSAVITVRELESIMRPATASGEKPPKMTEWIAPMRAQASIATAASGTIGI